MHHFLQHKLKKRTNNKSQSVFAYETLEPRKVLASFFPTYIDGEFTLGNGPDADSPYDLEDTFNLSSLPDSTKTIFLDFHAFHSVDNGWGHDIMFDNWDTDGDVENFSNDELLEIQLQFQNISEDFLPFGVNVTTLEPELDSLIWNNPEDNIYGVRVVNTQPTDEFGGFCGIAFLNNFNATLDQPVFNVCKGAKDGAMVTSHEVGHSLGLNHDGLTPLSYHPGAGTGLDSWGPLMGAPFGSEVTQWSDGSYEGATNFEDDYTVITSRDNGFGFRDDDYSNATEGAHVIEGTSDGEVFEWGIIGSRSDVDFFEFTVSAGDLSLSINAFKEAANLDIKAQLLNEAGEVLFESNPEASQDAGFDVNVPGGRYFLSVEGVGREGLYNDYGSVGFYSIEGVINTITGLPIGEAGRVQNISHEWVEIDFLKTYSDPVVVAGPASKSDGDPANVRIRNVTASSFEMRIQEWDYQDGVHGAETVDYLVMESGEYELEDGTRMMAQNRQLQRQRWRTNSLSDTFENGPQPIILSQTISENDPAAVTTRVRYVEGTEFQLRLQEEQKTNDFGKHGPETVSWIAIQEAVGQIGTSYFEAGQLNSVNSKTHAFEFQNNFEIPPVFLANMQTYKGADPAVVGYDELTENGASVFLEEERSADAEMDHTNEAVGYVAIELGEVLANDISLRPTGSNPAYDAIVGNKSRYHGNYPDYSQALEIVRARDGQNDPHSLNDDLFDHDHDHEHHDHDHTHELGSNMLSNYFNDNQDENNRPNSDSDGITSPVLPGSVLAELSGSILAEDVTVDNEDRFQAHNNEVKGEVESLVDIDSI